MYISPYMVSDCTVEQLAQLGETADSYEWNEILQLEGQAVQGEQFMEFYTDEQTLRDTVMALFYDRQAE